MTVSVTPRVRASRAADLAAVRKLLLGAGLPIEDLDGAPDLRFWIAEDGDRVVGAIGLEKSGAARLLRSLVVSRSHQKHGLGRHLVEALERDVAADGVELLVLLTQTADGFFRRLGYGVVERETVPDDVKQSAEFRSLCPVSAVCMTKSLLPRRVGVPHG